MKICWKLCVIHRRVEEAPKSGLSRGLEDVKQPLAPEHETNVCFFTGRLGTSGFLSLCRVSCYLLSPSLHLWSHNIPMTTLRMTVIAAITLLSWSPGDSKCRRQPLPEAASQAPQTYTFFTFYYRSSPILNPQSCRRKCCPYYRKLAPITSL